MTERHPHIVYVLADDLGYGDVSCNNPDGLIHTPHIDRLAANGVRFTDAHATTACCTPSRYNILTGRYAWRSRLKRGIVWPWDASLIAPDVLTVPEMLRRNGYDTACVGKWHLGWDWPTKDGTAPNDVLEFGAYCDPERAAYEANIDYTQRIGGGPTDRGFNSYFGVDVPNFTPYTWFDNDRIVEAPSVPKPDHLYGHPGTAVPEWRHEDMVPEFTRRAVDLIDAAGSDPDSDPLFLFLALTSPHSPVVPNVDFRGRSGIGTYGDFVCEVDWVIGQVVEALERNGLTDDTIVVFTSDNGPETRVPDDEGAYRRAKRTGHSSAGKLRGVKRDVWEGGHRLPFIVSWPGHTTDGAVCDDLVALGDLFATCADLVGDPLDGDTGGGGEDSMSFLPAVLGSWASPRTAMVHHSGAGTFGFRDGSWVFIDGASGGENREPEWFRVERGIELHEQPGELYDLDDDLAERVNVYAQHPEMVARMREQLAAIVGSDDSLEVDESLGAETLHE